MIVRLKSGGVWLKSGGVRLKSGGVWLKSGGLWLIIYRLFKYTYIVFIFKLFYYFETFVSELSIQPQFSQSKTRLIMNVVPRIIRRSSKLANKCNNTILIRRNVSCCQTRTFRNCKRGIYHRTARSFSSKAPQPLKAGFGINLLGAYFAYLAVIYGVQYAKEKSRPFNALSTGDDVMEGVNLSGKYAIVTGCNAGIGKETVRYLVKSGATVIMACRNLKKANKAKDDIIATFDESEQSAISKQLIIMQLDLGSLQSVYDFSKAFVKSGLKCDYLVNNAGIMMLPDYVTTTDDIERQWGMCIIIIYLYVLTVSKPVLFVLSP